MSPSLISTMWPRPMEEVKEAKKLPEEVDHMLCSARLGVTTYLGHVHEGKAQLETKTIVS